MYRSAVICLFLLVTVGAQNFTSFLPSSYDPKDICASFAKAQAFAANPTGIVQMLTQYCPPMFINFVASITNKECLDGVQIALNHKDNPTKIESAIKNKVPSLYNKAMALKNTVIAAVNKMNSTKWKNYFLGLQSRAKAIGENKTATIAQQQAASEAIANEVLNNVFNDTECQQQLAIAFPEFGKLISNSGIWSVAKSLVISQMSTAKTDITAAVQDIMGGGKKKKNKKKANKKKKTTTKKPKTTTKKKSG